MKSSKEWLEHIKKGYRHNHAYYHTIKHIEELFQILDQYKTEFLKEFPELDISKLQAVIAYHDIIYIPGRKDNEEESANLFILRNGVDNDIVDCILSTKPGHPEYKDALQKAMHDLDWAGFRDYSTMVINEGKIIVEAVELAGVTMEEAQKGQLAFYKDFADKEMYVTKAFQVFNSKVKENIARRISELEKDINA